MSRRLLIPLVLASVVVAAAAAGILARSNGTTGAAPVAGHPAPDFATVDLSGVQQRLSSYRGQVVLLNFWATWCAPCTQEMPLINAAFARERSRFRILAVAVRDNPNSIRQFVRNRRILFDPLLDPNGSIYNEYRLTLQPESFWIDRSGVIRDVHPGAMDASFIAAELKKLGAA